MCIIVIKPVGIKLPDDKIIKQCWDNNPDGAGIMYATNKKVYIKKGYMTWKYLKKDLKRLKKMDTYNIPIVMHFRITTHGGTSAGNTHPFPISNNIRELQALECTTALGIAHNGIINIETTKNSSDTMEYIRNELWYLYQLKNNFYKNKDALTMVYNRIQSKMVFMDEYGNTEKVGDFIEHEGCYYSNSSYLKRSFDWRLWDYSTYHDYIPTSYKTLQWLTSGYVKNTKQRVYEYDWTYDVAEKKHGYQAYTNTGGPVLFDENSKNIESMRVI